MVLFMKQLRLGCAVGKHLYSERYANSSVEILARSFAAECTFYPRKRKFKEFSEHKTSLHLFFARAPGKVIFRALKTGGENLSDCHRLNVLLLK